MEIKQRKRGRATCWEGLVVNFFRAVMVMKKKGKHEPFGNSIASGLGTD
jgi:hypothetical protein